MDFLDKQIAAPRHWEKFEQLSRALFSAVYGDPIAARNGRPGQRQHGVDVAIESRDQPGTWIGVQCKGKDSGYGAKATIKEFDAELEKAEHFVPPLIRWIFATTAPNDGPLQAHVREVSKARQASGKFAVDILSWDGLHELIAAHPDLLRSFYPEHLPPAVDIVGVLRRASSEALDAIDDTLSHGESSIALPRDESYAEANKALASEGIARLTGEGGSGKSGVLKRLGKAAGVRALVLKDNRVTAATLGEHLGQHGIHAQIEEILDAFAEEDEALCAIDGADRLLLSERRDVVLDLMRAIRKCATRSQWRIVTTARAYQGRDLVADALHESGFKQLGARVPIGNLSDDEISALTDRFPTFAPLLSRSDLSQQTRSLFMLRDLLRRSVPPNHVPSEVDAADSWIAGAALSAQQLAHRSQALAQFGNFLVDSPWEQPGRAQLDADGLGHLTHEGAVIQLPNQDAFRLQHDVHEDWLLGRHLHTQRNRLVTVLHKAEQPLWWQTAVRLAAQALLEQGDHNGWLALLNDLEDPTLDPSWRRAVLIAPLRSERCSTILPAIEGKLLDDDARLLRQLIETLLVFETRVDEQVFGHLEDRDEITQLTIASYFKVPEVLSWVPFLRWSLSKWESWSPSLIPRLSEVATLYARATSHFESRFARRIAEISHRWLTEIEDAQGTRNWTKHREPFGFKLDRRRAWEETEERLRDTIIAAAQSAPETMRAYLVALTGLEGHSSERTYMLENPGTVPGRLPREWVDMCLAQFVPPRKSRKPRDSMFDHSLFAFGDIDRTGIRRDQGFFPTSPLRGGFNQLFTADPVQGLRLLHRLERRAATHWRWRSRIEDGRRPRPVLVHLPHRTVALWGDEAVYRWARAVLGSPVLGSAYLALDDWLSGQAKANRPIGELVDLVLQNHGLVAAASPLIGLLADHINTPGALDSAGPFLGALRLWDYDIRRHMDDRGSAHRIGFTSRDSVHFEAVEANHARYGSHQPLSHSLLLPFRLLGSESAQAAFEATREKWTELDLAEYDRDLPDNDLKEKRQQRLERCLSDSDRKQISFKETEQGFEVAIAPPVHAAADIAAMEAANGVARQANELLSWVHKTQDLGRVSPELSVEDAIDRAQQLLASVQSEQANPHLEFARHLCGPAVAGAAAIAAQFGSDAVVSNHRTWLDEWLLGLASMNRDDEMEGIGLLPDDLQVLAAWGLAGLASRTPGSGDLDRVVANLATHQLSAVSAAVLAGLHWELRPDFARAMHIAALDSCVVDIGWWWLSEKEKARAHRSTARHNERLARAALRKRWRVVPLLPPPPDAWRILWRKEPWYPRLLRMPARRMLDWSKAESIFKGIDWHRMTLGGTQRAAFSNYLVGLVKWTAAYGDDAQRRDRQFPFEWANALADAFGRFSFAHGGGEEWRSLLGLEPGHRETDLLGRYLDAVIGALMATGARPEAGFWNAWSPAARWILENDIPKRAGDDVRLSTAASAAGMVGPYMTPIPPDWPHLESVLPAIDEWVRATPHLPAAAYSALAIVERMDASQRARWFLDWIALWSATNGSDERFWSFNGLGNKAAALLAPLKGHDKPVRSRARQGLGVMADGGATAARRVLASFSGGRR